MPGFDVDSDETARQKIEAAPERISAIAESIRQKRPVPELYERGCHAWLKHYVVRPLFQCYLKFNFFRVKKRLHLLWTLCRTLFFQYHQDARRLNRNGKTRRGICVARNALPATTAARSTPSNLAASHAAKDNTCIPT